MTLIYRVDPDGTVTEFYRGLGRPQGLAFDVNGNLYVAASHAGKRGIVRISPEKHASAWPSPGMASWAWPSHQQVRSHHHDERGVLSPSGAWKACRCSASRATRMNANE